MTTPTFRSKFELRFAADLEARGLDYYYEYDTVKFTQPSKRRTYIVDFSVFNPKANKWIYIETKGHLTLADRKKYLWVRESNPGIDLRFVFMNATNKIRKGSKTTYAMWADKHGFKWAEGVAPEEWFECTC